MRVEPKYILELLSRKLHELWNLVSLTIWNDVVLNLFNMDVIVYHVTLLVFYSVQIANLAFAGKI